VGDFHIRTVVRRPARVLEATPEIDIVVTDQAMPGMTGIELAMRIRELRPKLPIILATGYAELPDNPSPEIPRLSKPYRQEDLAAVINRLLLRLSLQTRFICSISTRRVFS
jgi:CheY-like chemotaxis protein